MNEDKERQPTVPENEQAEASIFKSEEELIKRMMETEAAIKQAEADIINSEKQIKQIKNSNTWKRMAPFRKILQPSDKQRIVEIEGEVTSIRHEFNKLKEILHTLQVENTKLDYNQLWRIAKEKKDAGTILDEITELIEQKQKRDENYNDFLKATARLFMNERKEYKELMYPKLLSGLKIEDIPEFMIRAGLTEEPIALNATASYRASLNMRMRELQLVGTLPEITLDDKQLAYRFMKQLNIRTPKFSDDTYTYDAIPEESGIVIKPVDGAGARGVYLVYTNDDIIDIKQSKQIANWRVLRKDMERDLEAGRVSKDEWFTEELILENKKEKIPARDLKFYCFYGKVALVLEIVRYPELKYCWWTADGERVGTGKYAESSFKGKGVTEAEIKMAEEISTEIPAPAIRIDFLKSEAGLVFGEFTSKPGNYDEFDDATDEWLGDYYIDAQGRLTNDLINGKEFKQYKQLQADI